MSKLLLLVQDETNVAHLDNAAQAILNTSITGVWVVFSPAITVNSSEAAAKLDAEIQQLRQAEAAAAGREDYEAAKGYKDQRDGKTLDRAKALRDAWKTAPAEERKAKTAELIGPFVSHLKPAGLNVKITGHSDHYDREQWVAMLNSLSGVWFKEFVPGSFIVAWPESVETSIRQMSLAQKADAVIASGQIPAAEKQKFEEQAQAVQKAPKTRRETLETMHHSSVKKLAREMELDVTGFGLPDIIEAILNAELASKREADTVDAY